MFSEMFVPIVLYISLYDSDVLVHFVTKTAEPVSVYYSEWVICIVIRYV